MESFLNIKNISYKYSFTGKNSKKTTKSLYKDLKLCFYEIFNNTIKYSSTDHVDVVFTEKNNMLTILIQEKNNFINFDNLVFGNGLKNIQKRMQRNNGNINFVNDKKQKTYSIIIKIKL